MLRPFFWLLAALALAAIGVRWLISSDFAAAIPEEERTALACVGRYALRGVQRAQELYTLESARLGD